MKEEAEVSGTSCKIEGLFRWSTMKIESKKNNNNKNNKKNKQNKQTK